MDVLYYFETKTYLHKFTMHLYQIMIYDNDNPLFFAEQRIHDMVMP